MEGFAVCGSYQIVSSTLTVLRNQLLQAEDDLERLMKLKEEALQDPVTFVEKLLAKVPS